MKVTSKGWITDWKVETKVDFPSIASRNMWEKSTSDIIARLHINCIASHRVYLNLPKSVREQILKGSAANFCRQTASEINNRQTILLIRVCQQLKYNDRNFHVGRIKYSDRSFNVGRRNRAESVVSHLNNIFHLKFAKRQILLGVLIQLTKNYKTHVKMTHWRSRIAKWRWEFDKSDNFNF